ncbi:MAG: hypothetical protein C0599_06725 [Salinivirgaceae bacterium]|nr:MAG: hypothetical protein C0599_06725 [Salinivirgaceae bacterium]
MIIKIVAIIIGLLIIGLAIYALHAKKLTVAILGAGAVSLLASIMFLLLAAPDVAMTEAAIGSGLSTIIFFYVLNKIRKQNG